MLRLLLVVVGGLAVGVVVVVLVGLVRVRAMRRRHRERVDAVRPEHAEQARLFGVASEGTVRSAGVGTLAVGPTHVVFVPLLAGREVLVPRDDVTSTSAARHFLGKTCGRDLLVVTWTADGLGDAAAFDVADVAAWRERLA